MPGGGRHCGVHLRLFNRICVMSKLAWLVVVFVLGFGGPVLGQRNVYVTTTVVNDYTVGDGSNFALMLGAFPGDIQSSQVSGISGVIPQGGSQTGVEALAYAVNSGWVFWGRINLGGSYVIADESYPVGDEGSHVAMTFSFGSRLAHEVNQFDWLTITAGTAFDAVAGLCVVVGLFFVVYRLVKRIQPFWLLVACLVWLGGSGVAVAGNDVYVTVTAVNSSTVGDGNNFGLILGSFPGDIQSSQVSGISGVIPQGGSVTGIECLDYAANAGWVFWGRMSLGGQYVTSNESYPPGAENSHTSMTFTFGVSVKNCTGSPQRPQAPRTVV